MDVDYMFLRNKASIFAHREPNAACGISGNWGDLEFGGMLNDLVPAEGATAAHDFKRLFLGNSAPGSAEAAYYDFNGRKIPALRRTCVPGALIARTEKGAFVAMEAK
jgi:hypothetical protein